MSKRLTQMQKDTIRTLEEIWEFYENDKLTLIEFLRSQHKEDHYTGDRSGKRQEEIDEAEMKLDYKRVFFKLAKQMIRKSVA